jgi:hypothetical protein
VIEGVSARSIRIRELSSVRFCLAACDLKIGERSDLEIARDRPRGIAAGGTQRRLVNRRPTRTVAGQLKESIGVCMGWSRALAGWAHL